MTHAIYPVRIFLDTFVKNVTLSPQIHIIPTSSICQYYPVWWLNPVSTDILGSLRSSCCTRLLHVPKLFPYPALPSLPAFNMEPAARIRRCFGSIVSEFRKEPHLLLRLLLVIESNVFEFF